jgi:N-acetylglucosamine malate deacetylase 1
MTTPYEAFVTTIARAVADAGSLPKGGFAPLALPALAAKAPTALVLAPHPDDECIIGGLPLRLRREAGVRVVDVAVTLGSNQARRAGRHQELEGACRYLGFDLVLPAGTGLERITPTARQSDPEHWRRAVAAIAEIITREAPALVFLPHANDWHGTHIGTHWLGMDALAAAGRSCVIVETEFWGALADPNLMVESSARDVADLCAATSFHEGEVARNPYHLRLPAWMLDNVRRGGELVGGQGGSAPDFTFATLYRLGRWQNGKRVELPSAPRVLAAGDSPAALLAL